MPPIPLPFTCQHESYVDGARDSHGNVVPDWADAVTVDCFWWLPESTEPVSPPTGGDQVAADLVLVVALSVTVDHRDRFTVHGHRFEVVGLPKDYDHGPFGYAPNRQVIELKWRGQVDDEN